MTSYTIVEQLIDKHGVADVLLMVSDICDEKGGHIAASYGDEQLEYKWIRAGQVMRQAVKALPKVPGIK
jgi:predicted GTPase